VQPTPPSSLRFPTASGGGAPSLPTIRDYRGGHRPNDGADHGLPGLPTSLTPAALEIGDLAALLASLANGPVGSDRKQAVTVTAANVYGSRLDGAGVSRETTRVTCGNRSITC
jgi:hypothetical protein